MTALLDPVPAHKPAPSSREASAPVQAALAASRATVGLFIRRGSIEIPIRELAANAGISERSFYRYFPRKEDSVRPFLLAGLDRVIASFAARPLAEDVRVSLEAAWLDAWPVREPRRADVLHRLLGQDSGFRAMLLQTVVESEAGWAEAIARRLNLAADSVQATFAGAAVCTAFRLAWKSFSNDPRLDPAATVLANLRMLDGAMFAPAPMQPAPTRAGPARSTPVKERR